MRHALALVVICAACVEPPRDPRPEPPRIAMFTTSVDRAARGTSARIAWRVEGADAIELAGLEVTPIAIPAQGDRLVVVDRDLDLSLLARSVAGEAKSSLAITAVDGSNVRIAELEVTPPLFRAGDALTIRWDAPGATGVTVRDLGHRVLVQGGPARHSVLYTPPGDAVIALRADGPGGPVTATLTASQVLEPPVITRFVVVSPLMHEGDAFSAQWQVAFASTCQLALRGGTIDQLSEVLPTASLLTEAPPAGRYDLALECSGPGGRTREAQAVVVVARERPAIEILSIEPAIVGPGGTVDVFFRAVRADVVGLDRSAIRETCVLAIGRCTIEAGASDETALLFAMAGTFRTTAPVEIDVDPALPTVQTAIAFGERDRSVRLVWQTQAADRITVAGERDPTLILDVPASEGQAMFVAPRGSPWLIVRAHGPGGVTTRRVRANGL